MNFFESFCLFWCCVFLGMSFIICPPWGLLVAVTYFLWLRGGK